MDTLHYEISEDLPLTHQADVIVVGSGPGGLGAAVMAARCGARTLLIERYGVPGGMASVGEIHPFMGNHVGGKPLDGPVYTDWIQRMLEYYPRQDKELHISKEAAVLAAEDLCLEAGVELLYHHQLFGAVVKEGTIEGVVLFSKSGLSAARAKVYIDCTGDADLAARAGCDFEIGGPSGHCQPMTLCFKLSHVDKGRVPERAEVNRLYDAARDRGELECPRENVLFFGWLEDDVIHFNTTRVIHRKGTSGVELSDAERQGRRQLRQFLHFFWRHVPGFENARLHSMGMHIGVRETRRVRGREYLTQDAFMSAAKFADGIARCRYCIDIHNPDGSGTRCEHLPEDQYYEIPYGCIVARESNNLLVGGRPISVDHAIHSSMRVMPPACSVGQAAGAAGAMAVQQGVGPAELDGRAVRKKLIEQGAWLD